MTTPADASLSEMLEHLPELDAPALCRIVRYMRWLRSIHEADCPLSLDAERVVEACASHLKHLDAAELGVDA
jgi:hypothetical protein